MSLYIKLFMILAQNAYTDNSFKPIYIPSTLYMKRHLYHIKMIPMHSEYIWYHFITYF